MAQIGYKDGDQLLTATQAIKEFQLYKDSKEINKELKKEADSKVQPSHQEAKEPKQQKEKEKPKFENQIQKQGLPQRFSSQQQPRGGKKVEDLGTLEYFRAILQGKHEKGKEF